MSNDTDMVEQLNRRFELSEHEARSGGRGKWFVFLKKQSIIRRLDDVVPMNWQTKIISSVRVDDRVEVVMEMTIGDITRSYDGVSEDNRSKSKDGKPDVLRPLNTAKAASTDAFKRVAMMFGIGLYLQDLPKIQASNESGALAIFTKWYNNERPASNGGQQTEQASETLWPSKETVAWVMGQLGNKDEGLSQTEILELAGVTALDDDDGWRKYDNAQAAVAHIQATFDAQLDDEKYSEANDGISNVPDNTEHVATFKWMNYIGSHSNLQFSTNSPGSKHNTYGLLYGGRGAIRKWGGDELYEQLQLEQFDKIKGKNIVSDFVEMVIPIEFRFVSEGNNGETYFKIVGIVGDPVISY